MRYIGNKTKIVDQIESLIKELKINKENYTFLMLLVVQELLEIILRINSK